MFVRVVPDGFWRLASWIAASATNFAAAILAARYLPIEEFGVFAIAVSVYVVTLGIGRATVAEPHLLTPAVWREGHARLRRLEENGLSFSLAIALIQSAVILSLWFLLGEPAFLSLAIFTPALLLQDAQRHIWFYRQASQWSAASDASWGIFMLAAAFAIGRHFPHPEAWMMVTAWAAGPVLCSAVAVILEGWSLTPRGALAWHTRRRRTYPKFVAEFILGSGSNQLSIYLLAGIVGVEGVAALKAAQLGFGPLQVTIAALTVGLVPRAVHRLEAQGTRGLRRLTTRMSGQYGALAAGWTVVLLMFPFVFKLVLGPQAASAAESVLIPVALGFTAVAFAVPLGASVRAAESYRAGVFLRLASAVLLVTGVVVGGALGGAEEAIWGMALAQIFALLMWVTATASLLSQSDQRATSHVVDTLA